MAKPTGTRTPLDAKRAKLRAKGLTEAKISKILINRQTAGSQPTGGAPPMRGGNMSGVLRNASAAVSYARRAIFGIRGDIRIFSTARLRHSNAKSRAGFWPSNWPLSR